MAKQSALELKREEAREEILAMKEKIPTARLLNFLGGTFEAQSLGFWLMNMALLNLITLSPWILIGLVLQESANTIAILMPVILATEGVILGVLLAHIISTNIIDDVANMIIGKMNNVNDLSTYSLWLKKSWSIRKVLTFSFGFCVLWAFLEVGSFSIVLNEFVGIGFSITSILVGLMSGLSFYGLLVGIAGISNIKNYRYDINTILPAKSEVIDDIDKLMTKPIYMVAAFLAIVTLVGSSNLMDQQVRIILSFPILLLAWVAIILLFLLTRSTENHIVNNAKWKTLNKIKAQINSIEATGDLSDRETAERLSRLIDIYKQVFASKVDTLSLKSLSTLFSQLMLPLLGLLLGNLDKVLDFFR